MATSTTTFTLTVTAAATTVLGDIVAELTAEFGTAAAWSSELSTPRYLAENTISTPIGSDGSGPTGQSVGPGSYPAFFTCNTAGNTTDSLFYCGSMHWRDVSGGKVYYLNGPTGWSGGSQSLEVYSLATDEFRHWQGTAHDNVDTMFWPPDGLAKPEGYGCSHNHDGSCINPATGIIYRDVAPGSTLDFKRRIGYVNTNLLAEGVTAGAAGTAAGGVIAWPGGSTGLYYSMEFIPGLGAQGTLLMIPRGSPVAGYPMHKYDLATGVWSTTAQIYIASEGAATCPHSGRAYFTDGSANNLFWSVGSDGVLTPMENTPVRMTKGHDSLTATYGTGADPNTTRLVPLGDYIYAFHNGGNNTDPNNVGKIYRYDVQGDSWGDGQPIDTIPYPMQQIKTSGAYRNMPMEYTVCCGIPTHNVILVVHEYRDTVLESVEAQVWKPPA